MFDVIERERKRLRCMKVRFKSYIVFWLDVREFVNTQSLAWLLSIIAYVCPCSCQRKDDGMTFIKDLTRMHMRLCIHGNSSPSYSRVITNPALLP